MDNIDEGGDISRDIGDDNSYGGSKLGLMINLREFKVLTSEATETLSTIARDNGNGGGLIIDGEDSVCTIVVNQSKIGNIEMMESRRILSSLRD